MGKHRIRKLIQYRARLSVAGLSIIPAGAITREYTEENAIGRSTL